jgi:hypothetical protein
MDRRSIVASGLVLASAFQLGACWLFQSDADLPTVGTDASTDHASDGPSLRDAGGDVDAKVMQDAAPDSTVLGEGGLPDAGGPSLCDDSGFLFCDGFEHGLDAWTITLDNGGTLEADSTRVFRGDYSLHVSLPEVVDAGDIKAILLRNGDRPPHYFERAFAYFNSSPPKYSMQMLTLNLGHSGVEAYMRGSTAGRIALSTYGIPDAGANISAESMPLSQWVCLEMELDGTDATLWVDGTETPAPIAFALPDGGITMQVGLLYLNPLVKTLAYEAWFDEFAVNGTRIGCEH